MSPVEKPGFLQSLKEQYLQYEPIQLLKSAIAGGFFGWFMIPPLFTTGEVLPYHATISTLIAPFILPPIARFVENQVNIIIYDEEELRLKYYREVTSRFPQKESQMEQFRRDQNDLYDLLDKMSFRRDKMRRKGYKNKRWR